MTAISHHAGDDLLLDYAAGTLAEGWSLAIATHLALCPLCRARVALMEETGAALLAAADGATDTGGGAAPGRGLTAPAGAPAPGTAEQVAEQVAEQDDLGAAWDAILARLDAATPQESPAAAETSAPPDPPPAAADGGTLLPEPLRSYLGGGGDPATLPWRGLGSGARQILIPTGDTETTVRLLRIPAGTPVPEHSHRGRELTLVLAGSFRDEVARFGRGDLEEADATLTHQPVAEAGADCICLAVTDAPLRFRSRLLRILQPILGI